MFLFAACGGEAGASAKPESTAGSIVKLLEGITDGKTAESAKSELSTLTEQLSTGITALKSAGEKTGGEAKDAMGALAEKAKAAVAAFSPELTKSFGGITEQITRLMGNDEIKKVIGPVLEKLKGLIAG
ncbi:MAG: hypothetical protein NXI31_19815 [bacterium]|nr:hypothetical protein [bacterium]